jgi:alkylation response protein AidB-like acyl-CoA dehydrogenase
MKREIYDADHETFRDSVRGFLDHEVKPNWDKYIEAKQFPREMWLAFGWQGLLGLEIPEQYGGGYLDNAVLAQQQAGVFRDRRGQDQVVVRRRAERRPDSCVQLYGGYGYLNEYRVARAGRDARVSKIWAGSNEIMKELLGRDLGL